MSRDDPELTAQVVKGISDGCIEAECALLGGETAILPEFYQPGEYDLAGFCLGVVERKQILDGKDIRTATRSSAWPARACTPTATAWPARSPSTTRAVARFATSRPWAGPWPTSCWSRRGSTSGP